MAIVPARRQLGGGQPVQPHVIGDQRRRSWSWPRPARPSRWKNPPPARPWCGSGRTARRRTGAEPLHRSRLWRPNRSLMAWNTGAGMRLHRNPVLRAQDLEIERRHDGDRPSAGRLVAAHLQPVAVGPDMVGVVDHPGRQPQQLALDLPQQREPARRLGAAAPARCRDRCVHPLFPALSPSRATAGAPWSRRCACPRRHSPRDSPRSGAGS